jgi:hypothetical protein
MTADEFRALKAIRKFGEKTRREMARSSNYSKQSAQKHGRVWGKVNTEILGGIGQITTALGIAGGVAGAVSTIISRIKKWRQEMNRVAKASAEAGREVTALAMMQEPGKYGEAVSGALRTGVRYGFRPGEAFNIVQQLQAQTGGLEKGIGAFRAAGRLSQFAGVSKQPAGQAISLLMGLGMTPDDAARAIYGAGEVSSLSPEEMATMASRGLPGYTARAGGPVTGLAAAAQLSEVIKSPERLGTYTERARSGLFGAKYEGFFKDILGRTGQPATMTGRLRAMQQEGITGPLQLAKAGFTEKREQRSLTILLRNVDALEEKIRSIQQMTGQKGLLGLKRGAAEEAIPQMKFQRVFDTFQAELERETKFPTTTAGRATQRKAEQRSLQQMAKYMAMLRTGGLKDIMPEWEPGTIPQVDMRTWMEAKLRTVEKEKISPEDAEQIQEEKDFARFGLLSLFMPGGASGAQKPSYRKKYPLQQGYERILQQKQEEYNRFVNQREQMRKNIIRRRTELKERAEELRGEFSETRTDILAGRELDLSKIEVIKDELEKVTDELRKLNQKVLPGVQNLAPTTQGKE